MVLRFRETPMVDGVSPPPPSLSLLLHKINKILVTGQNSVGKGIRGGCGGVRLGCWGGDVPQGASDVGDCEAGVPTLGSFRKSRCTWTHLSFSYRVSRVGFPSTSYSLNCVAHGGGGYVGWVCGCVGVWVCGGARTQCGGVVGRAVRHSTRSVRCGWVRGVQVTRGLQRNMCKHLATCASTHLAVLLVALEAPDELAARIAAQRSIVLPARAVPPGPLRPETAPCKNKVG